MYRLLLATSGLALAAIAAPASAQVIQDGRWVEPEAQTPAPQPASAPASQHEETSLPVPPAPPARTVEMPSPPPAPQADKPAEPQIVFAPREPVVQPIRTVPVAPASAPASDASAAEYAPPRPLASPREAERLARTAPPQTREPEPGTILPDAWSDPRFEVGDYGRWDLPSPAPDEHWIRYYGDAVLVDRDGRVVDRIDDIDWDAPDRGYAARGNDQRDEYVGGAAPEYGTSYPPPDDRRYDADRRYAEGYPLPPARDAYRSDRRMVPPPRVHVDGCDGGCGGTRVRTYYSGGGYVAGGYYYPPATTTVITISPGEGSTTTREWDSYESSAAPTERRYENPRRRRVERVR